MHRNFLIHKPHGYLSQFIYLKKRPKKLLGDLYDFPYGTMAIGRLDEDSEGLLLLTTDGMMSETVRSKAVEKEYYAQLDGVITDRALEQLKNRVEIGFKGIRYTTKKCEARIITELPKNLGAGKKIRDERHGPTSWISITLTEGKFRQVRKMTAAVGFPTLRLIRIRIGTIHLQNLKAGEVVELDHFDLGF